MIQRSTILCLLIAMLGGYALFEITSRAQQLEDELARLHRQITEDRETIHVLRAEWAYLSQPALLRERSVNHLNLVPIQPRQIVRFDDLPARPVVAADVVAGMRADERAGDGHAGNGHPGNGQTGRGNAGVIRTGGVAR